MIKILLAIFVVFILFIILYDRLTRFMVNPYDLVCYFGKKGSGKTSLISALRYELRDDFDYFYCSDKVEGTQYIDITKLGDFVPKPNSVLFIDEIGLVFNNRDFKSFDKQKIEFFKLQRHYKCKVICFSQVYDDSDKVIRNLFDEIHIVSRFARIFQMDRKINRKFDIFNYSNGNEDDKKGGTIIDVYKYKGLPKFRFLPRWIKSHDSFSTNVAVRYYPNVVDYDSISRKWTLYYFAPTINLFNKFKAKVKSIINADYD